MIGARVQTCAEIHAYFWFGCGELTMDVKSKLLIGLCGLSALALAGCATSPPDLYRQLIRDFITEVEAEEGAQR